MSKIETRARFSTLLIDLDGTLVDAFTTIHRGYQHTLPHFGLPAPTMAEVRRAVGGGIENAMAHFLPKEKIPEAIKLHTDFAQSILLEDVRLLPGGMELVKTQHARGMKLAVFTNKQADAARRICVHLGVAPYLDGVFGAGDTAWLKPDPKFSAHVLNAIGASADGALLIGDSPFDVKTGHNGNFPCWCVTTGTHSEAELKAAGADRIFSDLFELNGELGP
ncbi:MAG: HAD-superfamily hydrolase, subfamily variant 3 [Verrucomicrobia bacterium]|nr:HAD-superfamily hydrolase, subfamily variant 3 [Verrucomicrobiota bacterium]